MGSESAPAREKTCSTLASHFREDAGARPHVLPARVGGLRRRRQQLGTGAQHARRKTRERLPRRPRTTYDSRLIRMTCARAARAAAMFMKYNLAVRAKSLPKVFGVRWAEQCLSNAYVTTIHCVSASSRVAGGSHACAPCASGQSTSPACARRAAARGQHGESKSRLRLHN